MRFDLDLHMICLCVSMQKAPLIEWSTCNERVIGRLLVFLFIHCSIRNIFPDLLEPIVDIFYQLLYSDYTRTNCQESDFSGSVFATLVESVATDFLCEISVADLMFARFWCCSTMQAAVLS